MKLEKKNKFYADGDSPKIENGRNISFLKLIGIILAVILSPHMYNLGKKWRRGVVNCSKNVKIEIVLNAPLRGGGKRFSAY